MKPKTPSLFAPPEPLAARMRPRELERVRGPGAPGGAGPHSVAVPEGRPAFCLHDLLGAAGERQDHLGAAYGPGVWTASSFQPERGDVRGGGRAQARGGGPALAGPGRRTVLLLIDEIHRFNKAQQDALLPHVEEGLITLVGATTENPYFEIIGALLSRARIFVFEPLARRTNCRKSSGGPSRTKNGVWGICRWTEVSRRPLTIWRPDVRGRRPPDPERPGAGGLEHRPGLGRGHPGGPGRAEGVPAPAGPDVRQGKATPTTTPSAPSSRVSGARTWTRPSTGWPGC